MAAVGPLEKTDDALARLRIPRDDGPRQPSRLRRRLVRGAAALVILCAAAVGLGFAAQSGWLGNSTDWLPEAIQSRPEVRTARVTVEQGRAADAVVVATGYLESRRQAMIGARAAGRIEAVNVEEGTRVEAGEILAVLEHKDVDAALAAAKATLAQSKAQLAELEVEIARTKSDFERAESLWQRRSISEAEYDEARFAHQAAVAKRETLTAAIALAAAKVLETEQLRENMIIRAPFDGTVVSKDAEVGESILPGGMGEASGRGSVVTIADLAHLEVDCDVKEDYIGRVVPGAPAEVAVDAVPGVRFKGRVRKIIPMGDRARATIKVKVEILDADRPLFPDMSATAYFLPQEDSGTPAPERRVFCDTNAIREDDGGAFVWTVDSENRARRVNIKTGNARDGRSEILEGLQGGERVIVSPPDSLREGTLVKVRT